MTHYLAVWGGRDALSNRDAAKYYAALQEGKAPQAFDAAVYAFSSALTRHYPDLEMVPEEDLDASPWASAPEISGNYMIVALRAERFAEVFPLILQLAEEYGLVCFDPQNTKVHLPSRLLN